MRGGRGLKTVVGRKGGDQRKAKGLFLIENLDFFRIKCSNLNSETNVNVLIVLLGSSEFPKRAETIEMPCSGRSYTQQHRNPRVHPIYSRRFSRSMCFNKTDNNIGCYKSYNNFVISGSLFCNITSILSQSHCSFFMQSWY